MKILLLEPYFTGSHKAWAEGYARYSSHNIEILSLPGQFWKKGISGSAIESGSSSGHRYAGPYNFFSPDQEKNS